MCVCVIWTLVECLCSRFYIALEHMRLGSFQVLGTGTVCRPLNFIFLFFGVKMVYDDAADKVHSDALLSFGLKMFRCALSAHTGSCMSTFLRLSSSRCKNFYKINNSY